MTSYGHNSNDSEFTYSPSDNLSSTTTYLIKITSQITDSTGNNMSSDITTENGFITADNIAPLLKEIIRIPEKTNDNSPSIVFYTTEAGSVSASGSCLSKATTADFGHNTLTLETMEDGTYNGCKITVTDSSNNSSHLILSPFTIDSSAPIIKELRNRYKQSS